MFRLLACGPKTFSKLKLAFESVTPRSRGPAKFVARSGAGTLLGAGGPVTGESVKRARAVVPRHMTPTTLQERFHESRDRIDLDTYLEAVSYVREDGRD